MTSQVLDIASRYYNPLIIKPDQIHRASTTRLNIVDCLESIDHYQLLNNIHQAYPKKFILIVSNNEQTFEFYIKYSMSIYDDVLLITLT